MHNQTIFAGAAPSRFIGNLGVGMAQDNSDALAVIQLVAKEKHIPLQLLLHPSRCRRNAAHNRQLAMYLVHVCLGRSLTEVGQIFGRDRTTVSYACGLIEDARDDADFDAAVSQLEWRIEQSLLSTGGGNGNGAR